MTARPEGLPDDALPYKRTAIFDENTMPAGLRRHHSTALGVWGVIRILEGRLRYRILEPTAEHILDPTHPGIIPPAQLHEVEPLGPVRFYLEFYKAASLTPAAGKPPVATGAVPHG